MTVQERTAPALNRQSRCRDVLSQNVSAELSGNHINKSNALFCPIRGRARTLKDGVALEEETLITIMAVLVMLAAFTSILLTKLKLPSLVGFLIAGIIIANYVEVPEGTEDIVTTFSNLGLIMLMFAIGMEIDMSKLKNQGKVAMAIAVIQIPVMLFAGIIAGSAMGYGSVQSITMGAILSGASTAVVLAVLKANDVLEQSKMDVLILVMVIEDISQVVMISILTPMMQGQDMSTDSLLVLILSIAVFMVACFTLGLKIVPRIIDWFYERSNDELISLLCIGLVFVFALLANLVGLSVAIGAFLCGVMVGMSKPKHTVEHFIEPLKSLFMAMFFISVGMEVSVDSLLDNIPTILTFYAIFAVCMFTAVNIGNWAANVSPRDGWVSAMAMCTMGEFAFIISKQALDYGLFDQSFYSSVIGAAIVSMIILPLLVRTSEKTFNGVSRICPGPVRNLLGFITKQRDMLYHGLAVISYRSKESFTKGLSNAAFLVILIVVIELVFFSIYGPVSNWMAENIALDEFTWRIVILFINIGVLLIPATRLARFLRFAVYVMQKGKDHVNAMRKEEKKAGRVYENFSTLTVGAAITLPIVIFVPNGIDSVIHILVLLVVLLFIVLHQYRKIKKGISEDSGEEIIVPEDRPITETADVHKDDSEVPDDGTVSTPTSDEGSGERTGCPPS